MKENLSESKVFDADIARATMTISEYLSAKGIAGGVSLDGSSTSGAARLAADQGRKYEMGGLVAQGGMGAILDAKDCCVRRHVAMKVMLSRRQVSDDQILRFIEEAQITGQLEHPNIVPVHELGVDADGNVFYTMKYVRGRTLKAILADLRSAKSEVVREWGLLRLLNVYQRVCEAVAFAHSKGVIHRDLKPENIMVGDFGEVLVMDWGLAKVMTAKGEGGGEGTAAAPAAQPAWVIEGIREDEGASVVKTMSGAVLGTPQYMSPEQALGQVEALDGRTDVYALGAILYELLTLRPPVQGKSALEIMQKVVKGDYAAPSVYDRESTRRYDAQALLKLKPVILHHCPGRRVPPSLAAVAMKALAVKPEQRYLGVLELQREVEAYLHGFATMAEQAGAARQCLLLIKRHRTLAASILAIIVALTAGLGVALHQRRQAIVAKNEALTAQQAAEANLRRFEAEQEARLAVSRDAAPEFLKRAKQQLAMKRWDEARQSLAIVTGLDPKLGEGWYLLGSWHARRFEWGDAQACFGKASASLTGELAARAATLKGLSAMEGTMTAETIAWMAKQCRAAGETMLAGWLDQRAIEAAAGTKAQLLAYRAWLAKEAEALPDRLARANPKAEGLKVAVNVLQYESPRLEVTIKGKNVSDLSPLGGLPVHSFNGEGPIADLAPLRNGVLDYIRIVGNGHQLKDLSPLAGSTLTRLTVEPSDVADLSPLKGMSLTAIALGQSRVKSLDALRGMPLSSVSFSQCPLEELGPLAGAPLHFASFNYTQVASIEPLREAPLKYLLIGNTRVSDLTPIRGKRLYSLNIIGLRPVAADILEGMPLVVLHAGSSGLSDLEQVSRSYLVDGQFKGCAFRDLAPLAGKPLRWLHLGLCSNLKDLRPLLECPNLEVVVLPNWLSEIGVLRHHPSIKFVGVGATDTSVAGMMKAADFWQEYDRRFPEAKVAAPVPAYASLDERIESARRALQTQVGAAGTVTFRNDRIDLALTVRGRDVAQIDLSCLAGLPLTGLDLTGLPVTDLRPLRGMPLMSLCLNDTPVTDLSPVRGLPLLSMFLKNTRVTDLSPLTECPLGKLDVSGTPVSNLMPLAAIESLNTLYLSGCDQVTSVAAVAQMKYLAIISLPPAAEDVELLKSHPFLHFAGKEAEPEALE